MSTKVCRTVVLDDHPTDQDAFGSHKRIAHAILNTILHEEGGKAIALEGSWGSGKSTVIKILQKLIKANKTLSKNIGIFVFDAWAHQGDLLRSSFLDRFYNFLIEINWAQKGRWNEELDAIKGKHITKKIESKVKLHKVGRVALSLIFVWMVFTLAVNLLPNDPPWLSWALIVILVLFAVAGVFIIINNYANIADIIFEAPRIQDETEKRNIPDRSFIDFADFFFKMTDDALSNNDRRLVIVIDNLDRVDIKSALQIWSTMKAFFEPWIFSNASWKSQFWLIVPYDREGINRLWQEASQHKDLAEAFIDKTFQIRFRVPEPVLADWYQYMADRLKEAFPDHASDELETVRRVYRLYRLSDDRVNRSVTPREVNLFINQLGVLHRQWNDEIPLPIQAIYVLYRDEITENPCKALTDLEWIPKHILHQFHQEHLREYLGALHFNVEPEKVLHILIADRIEKALIEGDGKVLVEFQNLPGFVEVLDEIIGERSSEWASSNPSLISFSALSLQQLDALPGSIWRTLSRSGKGVNEWTPFNPKVAQGLLVLVDASEDSEKEALAVALIQSVSQTKVVKTEEREEEEIDERIVDDWSAGLITFVQGMHKRSFGELLKKYFRVPGTAETYIEVLSHLEGEENLQEIAPYFIPSDSPEGILQVFENSVENTQISEKHVQALRIIVEKKILGENLDWDSFINTMKLKILKDPNLPLSFVVHLFYILLLLVDHIASEQVTNAVNELSLRGRVFHYLFKANQGGNNRLKALSVVLLLEHNPTAKFQENWHNAGNGRQIFQNILNSPDPNIVKDIADLYTMRSKLDPILKLPKTYTNTTKICRAVLEHLVEDMSPLITSHIFVEEFPQFEELLSSKSLYQLTQRCCEKEDLVDIVQGYPFEEDKSELYLQILQACRKSSEKFLNFLREGLHGLGREIWKDDFEVRGSFVEILLAFPEDARLNIGTDLGDAIEEYISEAINDEEKEIQYSPEDFQKILNSLNLSSLKTTLRRIRDMLVERAANVELTKVLEILTPITFQVSGENLLLEDADDIVRRLFKEIIDNVIPGEMKWMLEILKTFPEILSKAKHESVEDLLGRIQRAKNSEELEEEEKKILEEIEKIVKNNLSEGND